MKQRDYLTAILTSRVYEACDETALKRLELLSGRLGHAVWLKREDEQAVFSFKGRGAYNKMAALPDAALKRGVIAASAGNHAQGVARAAKLLDIEATIVMPTPTPEIKVTAVKRFGANVVLHGDNYDAAQAYARTLMDEKGLTMIHPFDDPAIIAGQGTVGVEIIKQLGANNIDAVFVPCGGGGLLAGIAVYIKAVAPNVKVISVEPEDAASMKAAAEAGERVELSEVGIFSEGVAVKCVGEHTFAVARECVDDFITVTTDEICAAIKDIYEDTRSIVEPAGAVATAGLKKYAADLPKNEPKTFVSIASGANVNFDRLRHIAERAEIGEAREALLAVTIPEERGSFQRFVAVIGSRSVTEFNYRYHQSDEAHIFVGIGIRDVNDTMTVIEELGAQGFSCMDLSDNEMAKLHTRHMVGGRHNVSDERLIRFEFPERPGALKRFLNAINGRWNISLFHYRNHGAAFARILTGIQVPAADEADFENFLTDLGYHWRDESDNPAYRLFLG